MSEKKLGNKGPLVLDLARQHKKLAVIQTKQQIGLDLEFKTLDGEPDYYFMSPVFLFQTCLPHSQLKPAHLVDGSWVRHDGDVTLKVQTALRDNTRIPCGKLPRQFLIWLTNAINVAPHSLGPAPDGSAFPQGSQIFHINASMRQFCQSVGVDPSSGKRGTAPALIEQMIRVMSCVFTISRESKNQVQSRILQICSAGSLSWDPETMTPGEFMRSLDGGFVLSADFCHEVKHRKMLVPPEHLSEICSGKSPLRIDVYHWLLILNYHLFHGRKDSVAITWKHLYNRFGATCSLAEFVRSFRDEFEWINRTLLPQVKANLGDSSRVVLQRFDHPAPLRLRKTG